MSLLLLNVMVIYLSGLRLGDLFCQCEVVLASLLWGYYLDVIHSDFVHSVVNLTPTIARINFKLRTNIYYTHSVF